MDEPVSWQLMETLVGFINACQQPNFYFNWKANAEPFQVNEEDLESPDAVTVFDPVAFVTEDDDTTDKQFDKSSSDTLNVVIEAFIRIDEQDAQKKAHRARKDLRRSIPTKKIVGLVPDGVHGLEVLSAKIIQRPEGLPFVSVQIRIRASLRDPS